MRQKINILAIDTVFEQCSVALLSGDYLVAKKTIKGSRGQTEIILSMIDELFKENSKYSLKNIGLLAFNQGPGAFSSLRIGTAVVQALSFAHDIPCMGVSSLRMLAGRAYTDTYVEPGKTIASCMDARQNEVYFCLYQVNDDFALRQIGEERLLPYGSEVEVDFVTGDGANLIKTNARFIDASPPDAYTVGEFADWEYRRWEIEGVSAEHALPVYLRHNAWKTLAEQGKK